MGKRCHLIGPSVKRGPQGYTERCWIATAISVGHQARPQRRIQRNAPSGCAEALDGHTGTLVFQRRRASTACGAEQPEYCECYGAVGHRAMELRTSHRAMEQRAKCARELAQISTCGRQKIYRWTRAASAVRKSAQCTAGFGR